MPSRGPKRGRNLYLTPAFSGVPNTKRADKIQEFATSSVPSPGPKTGKNCYVTPAFSGVPNAERGDKIRSGHLTRAFSRAQNRAELLRNPCILGGPRRQARGKIQVFATSPVPSPGSKTGQNCYVTPAFSRVPDAKRGDISRIGHLTCPFSGDQKRAEFLVTPAFSGVPKAKRGDKIRSGHLTRAFSGARKRAELLRNPCIPGGPQRQARGHINNWPANPCLLGGPIEGGIST